MDEHDVEIQRAAYAVQGVDESETVQAGRKRKKADQSNGQEVLLSPAQLRTVDRLKGPNV